jgi:hypothetical protein
MGLVGGPKMIETDIDRRQENLTAENTERDLKITSTILQGSLFQIEGGRSDPSPGSGLLPGDSQYYVRKVSTGELFVIIDNRKIPLRDLAADIQRQLAAHG